MVEIPWEELEPQEALEFIPNQPKLLRFSEIRVEDMEIHIGVPPKPKIIKVLRLRVIEEDRKKVWKWWNVASKKAMMHLRPYIENKQIFVRLFKITKVGKPPKADYIIEVIPE